MIADWLISRPSLLLALSCFVGLIVAIFCLDFPDEDSRKRFIAGYLTFFSFLILATLV